MSLKKLCPLIVLLLIGCQQIGISQGQDAAGEADSQLGRQLKIYKNTLLEGADEEIRIDAASEMLFSEKPAARRILISVLGQSENQVARAAVCKALGQSRAAREPIKRKEDFIEPLIAILIKEDSGTAKLAAEALLIFEYKRISKSIDKILTDESVPTQAKLNAIGALKLQPDMRAIFKLINLLDHPDKKVAVACENALHSVGIPVGKDARQRKAIINELKRKGKDVFFRDLRIRQQSRMRELETELNLWQGRYLTALEKIYESLADDTAKGEFLIKQLRGPEAVVRLWALKKVSQRRIGTQSKLPGELNPVLTDLISDDDASVRLHTAKLLSLMMEVDSAGKLLEQLEVEPDENVQTELFVALGGACHYAFSPNSKIKVSVGVRKQALEWAVKFLVEPNAKRAQKGADAIRKLLERDGLTGSEIDRYFGLLSEKYKQQQEDERVLRGELLGAMAGLCAQSVYKNEATRLFRPLFEEAIKDPAALVREAAVNGLIYIDKARALDTFRPILVDDSSMIVRRKVIELAGEVGGPQDLEWLWEKVGNDEQGQQAWEAMLKIFKQPQIDASALKVWVERLDSTDEQAVEQKVSFFEIAARKSEAQEESELLKNIREKLANIHIQNGEYEQAAEYLGLLRETAQSEAEREDMLVKLLTVYLKWPKAEKVRDLIHNKLLESDLDPNGIIVHSIDNYLSSDGDAELVLGALKVIKVNNRPLWQKQMEIWSERFGKVRRTDDR